MGTSAGTDTSTYRMFRPDGPGPHPAVVFVSGCSGFAPAIAPGSYERTAEHFRRQGYVVVFADYLGLPTHLSAATCVVRCAVSAMTSRMASARAEVALLGFGDALQIF